MKKIISLLLAFVMVFSLTATAFATSTDNYDTSEVETMSIEEKKLSWLDKFKIARWLVRIVGQALVQEDEGSQSGGNDWWEKNSGFNKFGDADDEVLSVQHYAYLEEPNSAMWAFVYTTFGSWTKTLTLMAEYPDGSYVYDENGQWGGHVTHNQILSFFPTADDPRGEYQVHYVDDKENTKFDCYLKCWIYTPDARNAANLELPPEDSLTLNGAEVKYIPNVNKQFIMPSNQRINSRTSATDAPLNATQLSDQFYDSTYGLYVNDLKDYSVGDQIEFVDSVVEVNYDETEMMTELVFLCDAGNVYWQFAGDLRNRFAVGDTVNLMFVVEEEAAVDGIVFENLDYILDNHSSRSEGTYPNIDDYLVER